jgi:hypothetical protein
MSKLLDALRTRFKTPQECVRALGLDVSLINGPTLAADEVETDFRPLLLALRADVQRPTTAADARANSYADRFPHVSRIKVEH